MWWFVAAVVAGLVGIAIQCFMEDTKGKREADEWEEGEGYQADEIQAEGDEE
jgi:hypothetical protein